MSCSRLHVRNDVCDVFIFFFFQAEDGIRDVAVTGVQTCALPISQHRIRRVVGFLPPWRRRRHRQLTACGSGHRRRRDAGCREAARARAHQRSRDRGGASRGRRLSGGDRNSPAPSHPVAHESGSRLKTLLVGARQVVTCRGPARARRGPEMADVEVLRDAAVLIEGDRIAWVGPRADAPTDASVRSEEITGVLFPGFIDCHTHGVFGAPRLDDQERRALGVDYKAIAAAGGGILQSVRDVRSRPEAELEVLTRSRLETLMAHGATTIEVKSGYGLELEAELKQLRVIRRLSEQLPATLIPTFLGAHEVPPEYRNTRADYVQLICEEMLPAVARERLARCCDVFCGPGGFSGAESR